MLRDIAQANLPFDVGEENKPIKEQAANERGENECSPRTLIDRARLVLFQFSRWTEWFYC